MWYSLVIVGKHAPATVGPEGTIMLLTVDQAAERLGTTPRFLRRLRTERRIAVVKLGKHIRIDSNDLDAYIAASRQEPGPFARYQA
jgi:excisionase family DNA binding protein